MIHYDSLFIWRQKFNDLKKHLFILLNKITFKLYGNEVTFRRNGNIKNIK